MKHFTRAAVCAALALTGLQAHALYRCGSVYQDRPCDSSVEQKQLMKSGAVIITPATPATPAAKTAEPTVAPAPAPAKAVQPAQAAAAAAAAAKSAAAQAAVPVAAPVAPAAPPAPATSPAPAAAKAAVAAAASPAAVRPLAGANSKARCALLGTQLDSVESKARAGGSAADMERFSQERRSVQKSLVDAGC